MPRPLRKYVNRGGARRVAVVIVGDASSVIVMDSVGVVAIAIVETGKRVHVHILDVIIETGRGGGGGLRDQHPGVGPHRGDNEDHGGGDREHADGDGAGHVEAHHEGDEGPDLAASDAPRSPRSRIHSRIHTIHRQGQGSAAQGVGADGAEGLVGLRVEEPLGPEHAPHGRKEAQRRHEEQPDAPPDRLLPDFVPDHAHVVDAQDADRVDARQVPDVRKERLQRARAGVAVPRPLEGVHGVRRHGQGRAGDRQRRHQVARAHEEHDLVVRRPQLVAPRPEGDVHDQRRGQRRHRCREARDGTRFSRQVEVAEDYFLLLLHAVASSTE